MNSIYEIETKVLDINMNKVLDTLVKLGAKKLLNTRFVVDWFREPGTKEGEDLWFLRIRTNSNSESEVTWKAKSEILGTARKHKEINFSISEPDKLADVFQEIGLERYAHQEKQRISYSHKDWHFDIDQYPSMPPYLEIEGKSEEHIREAIDLLGLKNNKTWAKGERTLIQEVYGLNWYQMRF